MENNLKDLLQISTLIFEQLATMPNQEKRDEFIALLNSRLDGRGAIIDTLRQDGFQMEQGNRLHQTLAELDSGIRNRLDLFMNDIKKDMKDLQNAKKNEHQYMNPYADVRVMDGMYYDKKK